MSGYGGQELVVGIDVGSTTVKAVVVDPRSQSILWKDYQRHETRQAEKVVEFLIAIGRAFPDVRREGIRLYLTGSGSKPLCAPTGGRFVQEVNAVTMSVEALHPDVGSVIELGGQDAKIIVFVDGGDGERTAFTSMNDKCASGTGATIDKCMIKVGMPADVVQGIPFDASRLHHVAAKCGVFAETDIVNLVKSGIPGPEIMNSLADAIVHQNLSVLTRGNTLKHKVLLLGGPNTYLPFLQECWRLRIPETWDERGYSYPKDQPIESLIVVPDDAQYYAAYGAVLFGLAETKAAEDATYQGLEKLKRFVDGDRACQLAEVADGPLVANPVDLDDFLAEFSIPEFCAPRFEQGTVVRAVIGLDGGSTSAKAVLVDEQGSVIRKAYRLSKGNPIFDAKEILAELKKSIEDDGAILEVIGFGATGYAAPVLEESVAADVNIVETIAHMQSARSVFPDVDVVCDIGGQDIKVLFMEHGDIKDFKLSNQCSAGNGMLLQAMADQFGIEVQNYAETAFAAKLSPKFTYGCAVFLDSDRVNFQKEGYAKEELLSGLAKVLPKNVWQYVVGVPRLAELGSNFVLQGGTQKNLAAVKAQVDYIRARVPDATVRIHPHCGEAGAIGAAMETLRVVKKRGRSTFIGIESAIHLEYTSTNNELTKCTFCANNCSRTFIDTRTPEGRTSRYISGFSCEQGTVESKEQLKRITQRKRELRSAYPNLLEREAELSFKSVYRPEPLPKEGTSFEDIEVRRNIFGKHRRVRVTRSFRRSSSDAAQRRAKLRIAIPRVMNMYSTAPMWRAYFETLGVPPDHIVFSDESSEEMFAEGGKYGAIDPCYPSKVVQAHIHQLLFHTHKGRRGPFDYIFYPCITHLPSFVTHTVDDAACPVVTGTPKVIRAAFTKEADYFERVGIEYVDTAVSLNEPFHFNEQLWRDWEHRLQITRDEHDHAVSQAWKALEAFDQSMQDEGRAVLDQVERDGRVAVLVLCRPYHADPGMHHGIPEELQALGYPILSIRSIPKDEEWLLKYFQADIDDGRITDVWDIRDVWPENYSTNSVQKVWAARLAARHPNLAVLDLSSFKCGHDSPTYALTDAIIKAGRTPRLIIHDIDANSPGGSIAIRTKTFAHSLERYSENLTDQHERFLRIRESLAAKIELISTARNAPSRLQIIQGQSDKLAYSAPHPLASDGVRKESRQ